MRDQLARWVRPVHGDELIASLWRFLTRFPPRKDRKNIWVADRAPAVIGIFLVPLDPKGGDVVLFLSVLAGDLLPAWLTSVDAKSPNLRWADTSKR
jgi:hypothetical protein